MIMPLLERLICGRQVARVALDHFGAAQNFTGGRSHWHPPIDGLAPPALAAADDIDRALDLHLPHPLPNIG
jgi:hypothetical protein